MRLLRWAILLGIVYLIWFGAAMFVLDLSTGPTTKETLQFEVIKGASYQDFEQSLNQVWTRKKFTTWPLQAYLRWREVDRKLMPGTYTFLPPHTAKRLAEALERGPNKGETFTIIPGWDIRDIANALVKTERATSTNAVYAALGRPAAWGKPGYKPSIELNELTKSKPANVSWEGYLAPETIAFEDNASLEQIVAEFMAQQALVFTPQMLADIKAKGRTVHDILTMASLLEREVRSAADKALVADIFWKRHDVNMGLQADSSVHYIVNTASNVFTTNEQRAIGNPWNTYKYPQLPPGPIATPSIASIQAAVYPKANDYWYFLTTLDTGEVKYGRTLAEHNTNVQKYLR